MSQQPFSIGPNGIEFHVVLEGGNQWKRYALTRMKDFHPKGIRVEGDDLASVMISSVVISNRVVVDTPVSLSVVRLFQEGIGKKLSEMAIAPGQTLGFILKNLRNTSNKVSIYIDGE
jgi:hypothetical protein